VTAQQRTRQQITESNGNSSAVSCRRVVDAITRKSGAVALDRAVLVGISGIDASGKGYLAAKIADRLQMEGLKVATISADDWLNLPEVCINRDNYAEHFYEHAIRFDRMFEQLILPLREKRGISLTADCADAKATSYRTQCYEFRKINIVLLEGIFLFQRAYRHHFDLTVWIDCSFECALERAIERGQEGLPPAETVKAFETIYFPAQRIHFARDNPHAAADFIIQNGPCYDA
jgi:uridine kinase